MNQTPIEIYALSEDERRELALALLHRTDRYAAGRAAFRRAYPEAADEMVSTATHHVFGDGPPAMVMFLADAELFLRNPERHQMHFGVISELLYHLYNWLQFRELLPDGRRNVLDLLGEIKQFVDEQDLEAVKKTAEELEDALGGSRDYPQFE
jgi:hypothetical protein